METLELAEETMEACEFAEFGTVKSWKDFSYRVQITEVLREWTSYGDVKDRLKSLMLEVVKNTSDFHCIQDWLDLKVDLPIIKELSETLEAEKEKYNKYYALSNISFLGAIKALMKFPRIKIFMTCDNEKTMESFDKEWILKAVSSRRELRNTLKWFSAEQKKLKRGLDREGRFQFLEQKLKEDDELMKLSELEDRYKLLCRRAVSAKKKILESAYMGADLRLTCSFLGGLIKNLDWSSSSVPGFLEEEFENLQYAKKNKRGDWEEEENEDEHSIELKKQRCEMELSVILDSRLVMILRIWSPNCCLIIFNKLFY